MLERFFSVEYKEQGQVFEGLSIWKDKKYQKLQGTYPVIAISFADVKEVSFPAAFERMIRSWFGNSGKEYNGFIQALLQGNVKEMNAYITRQPWWLRGSVRNGSGPMDLSSRGNGS